MYIRTKDGRIAEVKENMAIKRCSENVLRLVYKDNRSICVLTGNDDIIKQADTIEELCDRFVVMDKETKEVMNIVSFLAYAKLWSYCKYNIYGAVWCECGLKYVAKLDDKGELELIWK